MTLLARFPALAVRTRQAVRTMPALLAALAPLLLPLAAPAPAVASRWTPVTGFVALDCERDFDAEAAGAVLQGFKLGADPDVLFDQTAAGGPSAGNALLHLWGYQFLPNWRSAQREHDTIVALVIAPGLLVMDSGDVTESTGYFGRSVVQVVGALDGDAPRITATHRGNLVEFAPVRQLTESEGTCAVGGDPTEGSALIAGYDIYRLPADEWLFPTLTDFRLHGFVAYVALDGLDFERADDGSGAADLRTGDDVTAVNPDGRPDSGDEIIRFHDFRRTLSGRPRTRPPDPLRPYWYRVQPVLGLSLDYFARGSVTSNGLPTCTLDLDGDGFAESVDLLVDGIVEFIDPSGHGLGLTAGGEILSSPWPGHVAPFATGPDADHDGLSDAVELAHGLDPDASNLGVDTDSDGLADAEELEIGSEPGRRDTDAAGESDGREVLHGRSPANPHDDVVLGPGRVLGDLAPRGATDGRVAILDAVTVLRMAVGVDTPNALERVLADLSPSRDAGDPSSPTSRCARGDGRVDLLDAVLVLRQGLGLSAIEDCDATGIAP